MLDPAEYLGASPAEALHQEMLLPLPLRWEPLQLRHGDPRRRAPRPEGDVLVALLVKVELHFVQVGGFDGEAICEAGSVNLGRNSIHFRKCQKKCHENFHTTHLENHHEYVVKKALFQYCQDILNALGKQKHFENCHEKHILFYQMYQFPEMYLSFISSL